MKKRVKFLDSIAILADPKPTDVLEEKYRDMKAKMLARKPRPASAATIEEAINTTKLRDRYGEPSHGFARDMSFKPDQEALINADLAVKWEAAGICVILEDASGKSKAA